MLSDIVFLGVAVLLTVLAGVFAATDTALATVSAARIDDLVKEGRAGARRLQTVVRQRATYVGLAVLLRVLCEVAATALVAFVAVDAFGTGWGLTVAVLAMTVVSYVAVGVGPRTLGRQNAYSIALVAGPILSAIGVLLRPVTRLLILVGNALTPGKGYRNGPFATEVEVREVVDMAQEQGVVDDDERRMIQSVFEFGDTDAREVMVPRPEMVWIEHDKSAAQAMSLAVRSGHSRIPVIGENPDDVLGVVYLKDVVERLLPQLSSAARGISVDEVMRDPEFVPDSKPLDDVLSDMQANRNHMALLVDEYGGIAGLVTIEDVLEEIVGEITDEYDTDEVAPIEQIGDDVYRVSSRLPVEDLEELFDVEIDLDLDDVDTVGGLLALRLGRVPLPGAKVKVDGLRMIAEGGPNHLGRQRITSVVVRRSKKAVAASPDEGSGDDA
ncbi:hemolysin family protein [Gordonia neofelifaecis]|uniref:CBS domain containing protein n=1 Tax=Gordonia neofelifaecis NRRL B-59395 TaxID=644548 RepID=F1YDV2_9ACTN|nr:hemolysin family protein [Gordonia neofelifaecis]EGD57042.1 CBS domain containing protein [Gordonia neofelifaecis NRRL B-59395]